MFSQSVPAFPASALSGFSAVPSVLSETSFVGEGTAKNVIYGLLQNDCFAGSVSDFKKWTVTLFRHGFQVAVLVPLQLIPISETFVTKKGNGFGNGRVFSHG